MIQWNPSIRTPPLISCAGDYACMVPANYPRNEDSSFNQNILSYPENRNRGVPPYGYAHPISYLQSCILLLKSSEFSGAFFVLALQ
jgi:hypothetical protein